MSRRNGEDKGRLTSGTRQYTSEGIGGTPPRQIGPAYGASDRDFPEDAAQQRATLSLHGEVVRRIPRYGDARVTPWPDIPVVHPQRSTPTASRRFALTASHSGHDIPHGRGSLRCCRGARCARRIAAYSRGHGRGSSRRGRPSARRRATTPGQDVTACPQPGCLRRAARPSAAPSRHGVSFRTRRSRIGLASSVAGARRS